MKNKQIENLGLELWSEEKIHSFRRDLLDWYDQNKRDLPWRRTTDPYAIWVSEIMLQQTRVDTVIPYYERFLDWFPTIASLAQAPEERLLKAWEGLGYYSRVRNMQVAAQEMVARYEGCFPKTHEEILSLKGIGPYTAGAIASIAFQLPEPAVDGNVMRVLSRLFEIPYDIGQASNRWIFQDLMAQLIDPKRPGDFNQALMDLGSDIESPVAYHPEDSPVKAYSAAYLHGTMDQYPIKMPKKKPRRMKFQAMIVRNKRGEYLLEKSQADLLQGFWNFPWIENFEPFFEQGDLFAEGVAEESISYPNKDIPLEVQFEQRYGVTVEWQKKERQASIQHTFSHQKWYISLSEGKSLREDIPANCRWVSLEAFSEYPFSKPQQKIWQKIQKESKGK